MNLRPARQGTSRRDELRSGNLFVGGETQQGGSDRGFDRRQNNDVSHASKLRRSRGEKLSEEEGARLCKSASRFEPSSWNHSKILCNHRP